MWQGGALRRELVDVDVQTIAGCWRSNIKTLGKLHILYAWRVAEVFCDDSGLGENATRPIAIADAKIWQPELELKD
jgi:hypothetical protein